jgi:hypothetical protein
MHSYVHEAETMHIKWTRRSGDTWMPDMENTFHLTQSTVIDEGGPVDAIDLVLLFSDGVESFTDESGVQVPLHAVLDEVLGFKNYTGQFIARRSARFLKDAAARGWKHSDDFSCAGIYLGDTP